MIRDISNDVVKAVVPEYGCITVPLSELLQDQAACVPLSLWTRQSAAKVEFSWFLPQIRKYRRSLIEVLVTSLVLQL